MVCHRKEVEENYNNLFKNEEEEESKQSTEASKQDPSSKSDKAAKKQRPKKASKGEESKKGKEGARIKDRPFVFEKKEKDIHIVAKQFHKGWITKIRFYEDLNYVSGYSHLFVDHFLFSRRFDPHPRD